MKNCKTKSKYKLKKYNLGTDEVLPDYSIAEQQKEMGNNRFTATSSLASMIPGDSKYAATGSALGDTAEGLIGRRADGSAKVGGSALGGGLKGAGTGAAIGSMVGPMGTAVGAGVGAVVGTIGGAISAKENQRLVKNATNTAATFNYQNKFKNTDVDQIGYAKHGLDMTGDKTKYKLKPAAKTASSEPIMTQKEKEDLNMLHSNPEVYKQAYQDFIGYKPIGSGAAFTQKNSQLYNERVSQHNQRDTSATNFVPFNFQPYAAKASAVAIQNNLAHPSTNKRLDKYIVNKGGEVSNMGGVYKKGTKSVKPVEVEGDEILMEKSGGKYKMKADFKDGKTHEEGGIPIIAEEGDIIYPANKRDQVVAAYNKNDNSKLESIRKTLPTDTKYKKALGDNGVGLGYKKTTSFKPSRKSMFNNLNTSAMGVDASESIPLDDSIPKDKSTSRFGNIASSAMEFAPIAYNIGKGLFDKSVKTNRRSYNPEQFQYTDISQPIRNEAENAYTGEKDQIRNAAGGSSANYLAAQSLAGSRKYQRMQDINNNEGGRKVAVTNMNTELNNSSKMANLNLQNQYDELDLRNDAAKKKHLTDGFSQMSDASQKYKLMSNQEGADSIRARTLQDLVANYNFDPNSLNDKDKALYGFKLRKGTQGIKGNYKMKKNTKC